MTVLHMNFHSLFQKSRTKAVIVLLLTSILFLSCNGNRLPDKGMVVSASKIASEVGLNTLKKGGNAFDAAVATGFALAVVYPEAGNIGGGGFMVAFSSDGVPISLDFREKAPARAHRDIYLDADKEVIPDLSLYSHLASAVPGTVDGLITIYESHGSGVLSLADLMEPAIELAQNGFPVDEPLARSMNGLKGVFMKNPAARDIFIKNDGSEWTNGDMLIQKDLAWSLRMIADSGKKAFYDGPVGDLLVKEMQNSGGWITKRDLREYSSIYRAPVWGRYKDFDIFTMGPPSSGGALLIEMLNMVSAIRKESELPSLNSPEYIHLITEIERRAFADRSRHFGDPDFYNVPLDSLISVSFAARRISTFDTATKTASKDVAPGNISGLESAETTHYSIVDKDRNCVSITYTLNMDFGSRIVVDGTGFLLNNEMDDFSSKPGVPNYFGLIGNEVNAIAGKKRPLSSMTPTVILKENTPFLVLGSPGGSRIITSVFQVVMNVLEYEMDVPSAVKSRRFHSQWLPDNVFIEENSFSSETGRFLRELGHEFVEKTPEYFGAVNAIGISSPGLSAGPDPRRGNYAAGY